MKNLEVELKYNAENIDFTAFQDFAMARNPLSTIIASGYDRFYADPKNLDSFCRHRIGPDMNQLTFKKKDPEVLNNIVRIEHNLNLSASTTVEQISALVEEFGYKYNTTIFKTCFVYDYEWYSLVYYIVHDTSMKELGRFLEIEAKEDHCWGSEQEAMAAIVSIERFAKSLGITPQNRLKKSLWEMYRKT